jgi:putative ABC transport system permease protein
LLRFGYQQVFESLAGRADLEVVARGEGRFDENLARPIRTAAAVRAVVPAFHRGTIVYAHGTKAKVVALGIVSDEPESLAGFQIVAGHLPAKPGELAMETSLAAALQIKTGESVRLLTSRGLRSYRVSGLVSLESASRLRQGGMVLAPLDHLQRAFNSPREVDALNLFLTDSKRTAETIAEVSRLLPSELRVQVPSSRSGLAEETLLLTEVSLNMASALSFTTAVFMVLSVFLMNVSERRQQLSILRALGATRRQIVGFVGREALVMGVVGTVAGIPVGIYGGRFLTRSMAALLHADLPETPDLTWALVVGALLGPTICLAAAWYPARKASRISPLEGMRPVVTMRPLSGHRSTTVTGLMGLVVAAALAVGTARGIFPIWLVIADLIISLVSCVLLLPAILPPAVYLAAWPLRRLMAVEGEISQRLVLRHAGRSSLTIGVLFMAVSAGVGTSNAVFSITDDVRTWYECTITADFLVRAMMPDISGQTAVSLGDEIRDEIAALGHIKQIEAIRLLRVDAAGRDAILVAREFNLYDQVPLAITDGNGPEALERLRQGEVVLGSVLAQLLNLRLGGTVQITYGPQSHSFRIGAVATEYTFGGAVVYLDRRVAQRLFGMQGADSFLIRSKPGEAAALEPKLRALAQQNGLLLQSFTELVQMIDSLLAGVTGGLWVLLSLGLFVGALGVVNTLTINVLEQTRELGMLRAIGMRRAQVVFTVLGQAALIGAIGVLAGGVSGVSLARMINVTLGSMFGHDVPFALRPHYMVLLVVAALALVMLSAFLPARRAARLDPILAMRNE